MDTTLPQRMGMMLLDADPGIVDGRVIDRDFRAIGATSLEGVIPGSMVEVRNAFGKLNPLIVFDDQGPERATGAHNRARVERVAVWIFYPESAIATREIIRLRQRVDAALHDTRDLLPDDHLYAPGEGTRGRIMLADGIGTISDGEAVYDQLIFRVSHIR